MRLFCERAVSFIRSHYISLFSPPDTSRFLKERNARLLIQMKESRSFYGIRLDIDTEFYVNSDPFRIRVHLLPRRILSISVSDSRGQDIHQEKLSVTPSALALSLNLDKVLLQIVIDADQSVNALS